MARVKRQVLLNLLWLVQTRINEAKQQVDNAIWKVEEALRRLRDISF